MLPKSLAAQRCRLRSESKPVRFVPGILHDENAVFRSWVFSFSCDLAAVQELNGILNKGHASLQLLLVAHVRLWHIGPLQQSTLSEHSSAPVQPVESHGNRAG